MSLARSCNRPKSWLHLVPPSVATHFSAGPVKPAPPSRFPRRGLCLGTGRVGTYSVVLASRTVSNT